LAEQEAYVVYVVLSESFNANFRWFVLVRNLIFQS